MKKGIICLSVALLVTVSVCGFAFSGKPEGGVGLGVFEQHLVGTWDVFNKSSHKSYNESEGEVVFSWAEEGIEIEVTSGAFTAGNMVFFGVGNFAEYCMGPWPVTFYNKEIAMVEWDAVNRYGNYKGPRKSPLRIVKLNFDKLLVVGMGYKGYGISILTRQ